MEGKGEEIRRVTKEGRRKLNGGKRETETTGNNKRKREEKDRGIVGNEGNNC